jgi:formate dehydrogenase assembly factor FdhD
MGKRHTNRPSGGGAPRDRVRGRAVSVTMRTPGHDEELALGFLPTEGIIRSPRDVLRVEPCARNEDGNLLNVVPAPDVPVDFDRPTRHVFASSSCGRPRADLTFDSNSIFQRIDQLLETYIPNDGQQTATSLSLRSNKER